jgi:hypothetical protein
MIDKPISIVKCSWIEINLNADSKFMRIVVFLKFFIWDLVIRRCGITTKECWVIAGINTVMTRIPPR